MFKIWWLLVIGMLVLGALGYIEKIFNLRCPRRIFILLLIIFLVLSISQSILSFYNDKRLRSQIKDRDERISSLGHELQIEKTTIRDFASKLQIKFSGRWSPKPYPAQILSPVTHHYYIDLKSKHFNHSIKFYATQPYQFHTIDNNHALFESRQAVQQGVYPLGKSIDVLSSIDEILIHIPFISDGNIKDGKIIIEQVEMALFVNGEERHTLVINGLFELPVVAQGPIGWANLSVKLVPNTLTGWLEPKQNQ